METHDGRGIGFVLSGDCIKKPILNFVVSITYSTWEFGFVRRFLDDSRGAACRGQGVPVVPNCGHQWPFSGLFPAFVQTCTRGPIGSATFALRSGKLPRIDIVCPESRQGWTAKATRFPCDGRPVRSPRSGAVGSPHLRPSIIFCAMFRARELCSRRGVAITYLRISEFRRRNNSRPAHFSRDSQGLRANHEHGDHGRQYPCLCPGDQQCQSPKRKRRPLWSPHRSRCERRPIPAEGPPRRTLFESRQRRADSPQRRKNWAFSLSPASSGVQDQP